MIQNLATPALNNVADAITSGVDPDEFVAAMHCNPQGEVWRNAEGVLLQLPGLRGSIAGHRGLVAVKDHPGA